MALNDWSYGPLSEFDRLRRQMDDLFSRFGVSSGLAGAFPAINIYDEGESFIVAVEAPGVSKENLSVEVRENILSINGKREEAAPEGAVALREECPSGEFQRSLRLPSRVRNDSAEAHFKDGILLIKIPKTEEAKPRQIAINA
jgi:HSP20 family protein